MRELDDKFETLDEDMLAAVNDGFLVVCRKKRGASRDRVRKFWESPARFPVHREDWLGFRLFEYRLSRKTITHIKLRMTAPLSSDLHNAPVS